jgi:hypothetical protein
VSLPTLADRYGGGRPARRRRAITVAAVAVLALVGLGWVVYAGLAQGRADVQFNDVGFAIVDDASVQVTWDVGKDPKATAVCTLRALDRNKTAVGIASVTVGPTTAQVTRRTDTVRTSALAVTGMVRDCAIAR